MMFLVGSKEYIFKSESFAQNMGELVDIMLRNHAETGIYDMPLAPDFQRLAMLESEDSLRLMTARLKSEIVGYAVFFVDSQIFQKNILAATQSSTFVDKEHRAIGYAFIKFCDDMLKKQGINSVWRQASAKRDISKLYERLGYQYIEKSFLRRF